ncbi:hypothetical protein SAMD00019534_006600 [Acytostelium subglobosum LB1]|uniref:hypothetical protein n=1 Tax=Acytostelium subglobosum LB1 TaxID=1410327 RepID=UPI000644B888|nr:hypothetical protein SAMD00019534_006600 [Acytostelium subglobosum LB1]GAM17485.1 hypothetical protein SAMD00019534_006600 [Acytostelium subglobosum LB1]|eukprot:XP_012759547.1 hypothetical protein SAMD00019534_006600 [Acytostelium subglobosum LB1]
MGHRGKLGGALVLTVLLLGCLAVSYSFSWYREDLRSSFNIILQANTTTTIDYFWTKTRTTVDTVTSLGGATSSHTQQSENDYTDEQKDVKQVFTISLSFLTASAAAALALAVFQIIGIISRSRFFRILSGIAGLASFALLAVAFFQFFGITKALDKDNQCGGYIGLDNSPCESFFGSTEGVLGLKFRWFPFIGWWVGVGGLAFSLLSAVASFLA